MPFCKICFDAKRNDYLEHNIKIWNGARKMFEVSCTYLKNIECSNCGEKGHTMKYCSHNNTASSSKKVYHTTNSDIKNKNNTPFINNNLKKSIRPAIITYSNRFNILNDDNVVVYNNITNDLVNADKISYTYDGELIGNIDDIVWGNRPNCGLDRWSDYV